MTSPSLFSLPWSLSRTARVLGLALGACGLVGCGSDEQELAQWTKQQRNEARPNVTPLTAPKKFDPQPYEALASVEPFSSQKLTVAMKQEARQPSSLLASELNRRKEPLEAYPLDNIVMVGSLMKTGQQFALLKVNGLLYQVKAGEYLGQNFGRVLRVGEAEISLREIVQDAVGDWIERPSSLQLQEKSR
ncbi:MAG: pilus assembly protein PilP [Pseudomonadota bacterium]